MARTTFTAGRVGDFTCPDAKQQAFLWDDDQPGLGLRATAGGAKAYVYQSKLAGRDIRITIGSPASWSIKEARKEAMDGFRKGDIRVLVASDIAARGLDIKGVTHIFNLDAPTSSKAYLHRVGRTGRAGEKGLAVTLMTEIEARLVRRYEEELGIVMQCVRMREGKLIAARH